MTPPFPASSIILGAAIPGTAGTAAPHDSPMRAAFSALTASPPGKTSGPSPTSAPPWTPLWPRIGITPHFSRPTIPRTAASVASDRTFSTPNVCCVSPIE